MNKLLLTCFLALLCLVGRYLIASHKVADSPGAELLHRSDSPNREGETLPDSFTADEQGIGFLSLTLDSKTHRTSVIGHPTSLPSPVFRLRSSPNQTATSLSGAPRSDDPLHRPLVLSEVEASVSRLPSPHPTSQGQKGGAPSIPSNGMLYIELDAALPSDSLYLRFWDHLVSERMTVTPGSPMAVPTQEGNFFEGNINYRIATAPFPVVDSYGYFSIGKGKNTLAKHWYYFPSDRIRIRFDFQKGSLAFGGPNASFYRVQHELDRAFREVQFNASPILISGNPETLFKDSLSSALWNRVLTHPEDLYVRMQVISTAEQAWEEFERFISHPYTDHPAWKTVESQSNVLTTEQQALLQARIKGEILFQGMLKSEMAMDLILADPEKFQMISDWVSKMELETVRFSHPLLAQGTFQWAILNAYASNQQVLEVLRPLSHQLRDEVIAFYLLDNFNRMGEQLPQIIQSSLAMVESPWITQRLQAMEETRKGSFMGEGMQDQNGQALDFSQFKGKSVLIHYWISGCKFCIDNYKNVMRELSEKYANDPDIVILTVNGDKSPENWKKSLATGQYASPSSLNLWVPQGTGLLKTYNISSFPQKMLIGPNGGIQLQTVTYMSVDDLSEKLAAIRNESIADFSQHQTKDL